MGERRLLSEEYRMPATPLHRLVYSSTYRTGRIDNELLALRDILSQSRKNNQKSEITGYLMFDGESFVQVLEGPRESVEATMARIAQDERHRDVTIIAIKPTESRAFHNWTMGGYRRSAEQDPIFRAHGIPGQIDRAQLSFDTVVSLAIALGADQAKRASSSSNTA
ncbi:BLUF domain-containing protein [Bosea sp. (in: a-proteobacteria)]|uniref:BLUF domain-containing protein n=1 Tax=Bosea sp. (in: a-proteobacteria) TaxID=1871050 RepID=UPI003568DED2